MVAGKLPPSSAGGSWLALQSAVVYSPYKNIYIETACSYAYKANAFRLGQAPAPYSARGIAQLSSEPSASKAGQKPASISENRGLYMDSGAPCWLSPGEEASRTALTSTLRQGYRNPLPEN